MTPSTPPSRESATDADRELAIEPLLVLKIEDVADTLYNLGWRSPNDAQWDGLKKFISDLESLHRIGVRAQLAASEARAASLERRLGVAQNILGQFAVRVPVLIEWIGDPNTLLNGDPSEVIVDLGRLCREARSTAGEGKP